MRLGNLITTDISQAICVCLAELGFPEATSHRQQDCAQLFEFLTDTLAMPLLTSRVEIQHSEKYDNDDRRYSKKRILYVSVPEPDLAADGHAIILEECLEHYFNNSISVKHELQRRATLDGLSVVLLGDVIVRSNGALALATAPSALSAAWAGKKVSVSRKDEALVPSELSHVRVRTRSSMLSVWSINSRENKIAEVMVSAWMLLRLLPFYTDDNDTCGRSETLARSSQEFAHRRPLLPICLKLYSFSKSDKKASRMRRRIVIQPVITVPLFLAADTTGNNLSSGFKLILESAVCHRGS